MWDHFDPDKRDTNKVVCRICNLKLAYNHSTSSMRNHLRFKHVGLGTLGEASGQTVTTKQTAISSFTVPLGRRCDAVRSKRITDLITNMITKDMLPLSFVEGEGFRKLMECVEPEYKVPSRKTVTARVESTYDTMASNLKSQLMRAEAVAITTDGWTALTTESYMTITCHYIADADRKKMCSGIKSLFFH